jgi:hypothetical protein
VLALGAATLVACQAARPICRGCGLSASAVEATPLTTSPFLEVDRDAQLRFALRVVTPSPVVSWTVRQSTNVLARGTSLRNGGTLVVAWHPPVTGLFALQLDYRTRSGGRYGANLGQYRVVRPTPRS